MDLFHWSSDQIVDSSHGSMSIVIYLIFFFMQVAQKQRHWSGTIQHDSIFVVHYTSCVLRSGRIQQLDSSLRVSYISLFQGLPNRILKAHCPVCFPDHPCPTHSWLPGPSVFSQSEAGRHHVIRAGPGLGTLLLSPSLSPDCTCLLLTKHTDLFIHLVSIRICFFC